ncbi:hypothetical protein G6L37_00220 [Agrobacterium rubi]|nr:hypothetical protein [Agrobacterium rubi]NTF23675.1 hypothetical protein [Agrobacterium rubi]
MLIADAILRELHRLPFVQMIENVNAGRPALNGLGLTDYLEDAEAAPEARAMLIDDGFTARDHYAPEALPAHLRY